MDPSAWDDVAIWSLDGQIVYATDRSLIGQRPDEARSSVRDATESGTISSEQTDGMFSVLIPLRFRSDGPISAAIQLARPDDLIAAAGRPVALQRDPHDARSHRHAHRPLPRHAARRVGVRQRQLLARDPGTASRPGHRPGAGAASAGAGVARASAKRPRRARKAEERATAAEERLTVIQDQYRKTLEELHVTQRMLQERPASATTTGPDPEVEARLLKAEGQSRLLEGQLAGDEHGAGQARPPHRRAGEGRGAGEGEDDPEADRKARQVEQEAIGLRAELEGAQTELSLTRRELDALKARGRAREELKQDLDAAHVEALHAREAAESAQTELARATTELVDVRNELRALRTEEQKASIFGEELRAARAELDSLKASHAAELVEREADLEARVRATREEFQAQIEQSEAQAKSAARRARGSADEGGRGRAVAELRRAADEREAELQTHARRA